MPEIRVQPRSVYEHHIYIQKAHTTLNWTFSTKKKSICFGLYFRKGNPIRFEESPPPVRESFDEGRVKKRNLSLPKISHLRIKVNDDGSREQNTLQTPCPDGDELFPPVDLIKKSSAASPTHTTFSIEASSSSSILARRRKSSAASVNLLDKDFVELIPVDQVHSSKEAICGSYVAEEPGNYILLFDNMFSRNTSKTLSFTVTSDEPIDESLCLDDPCDLSGWLLKKRRKRMQGWAKRWFELSPSGILSYSVKKGGIKRGFLQIMLATVSISIKQHIIHLDSGTTIFHIKALSNADFEKWMQCLRYRRAITGEKIPNTLETEEEDPIVQALMEMENEIKSLKSLLSEAGVLNADYGHSLGLLSPTVSPASVKKRFPFKRAHLSNTSIEDSHLSMPEKINQSLVLITDFREKISMLHSNQQSNIHSLGIPGPNFLSNRSASFYSFRTAAQSEQYFDAEDILISNDEEEEEDMINGSSMTDSEGEDEEEQESVHIDPLQATNLLSITRRTILPHPVSGHNISVLGILRKNIGKDLSTISMPISLNEPINLLQRLCEEMEYSELLDKAACEKNVIDRLMYVTAFAISGYASSQFRIGRKPFNPLLGETYECIRPDKGFRFISEKVSHHPNVMASCAESKHYKVNQTNFGKTKFWGKSMELVSEGCSEIILKLGNMEEQYTFTRPSSWVRNIVAGSKYLDHVGEMKVTNHTTGEYAVVTFKEATGGGFFGTVSDRNNVVAQLYNENGTFEKRVSGKWSDTLSEELGPDQYAVIWRSGTPNIPNYPDYYGFTQYCMELNEITDLEKEKIPKTDTRYRPDQRFFENGSLSEAEDEKVRIEQNQRERRKHYEMNNQEHTPMWFQLKPDNVTWEYNGDYWESRNKGEWSSDMLELW